MAVVDSVKVSPASSGRMTSIRLAMCTRPTAGNGKRPDVISSMCSGNASTCGYVGGTSSRSRKPHTFA